MTNINFLGNCCHTATRDNPNQGRVYGADGLSPNITNVGGGGNREPMIIERWCVAQRGRYPDKKTQSEQRFELYKGQTTHTITSVSKDNLVLERYKLRQNTTIE